MDNPGQTKVLKLDDTMHYHGKCMTMVVEGILGWFTKKTPIQKLDETMHYHDVSWSWVAIPHWLSQTMVNLCETMV